MTKVMNTENRSTRPMRAFAEGLRWLDRYRTIAKESLPSDLPPLSGDDVYALAYAQGLHAGQASILKRFVGRNNLSSDEIWQRLSEAISWATEPVEKLCPSCMRDPDPRGASACHACRELDRLDVGAAEEGTRRT